MTYLLKQHDDVFTGTMLELEGVFTSGKSTDEISMNLKSQSLAYFKTFTDVHNEIIELEKSNKPLSQTLPKSTNGKILRFVNITVECPTDAK